MSEEMEIFTICILTFCSYYFFFNSFNSRYTYLLLKIALFAVFFFNNFYLYIQKCIDYFTYLFTWNLSFIFYNIRIKIESTRIYFNIINLK